MPALWGSNPNREDQADQGRRTPLEVLRVLRRAHPLHRDRRRCRRFDVTGERVSLDISTMAGFARFNAAKVAAASAKTTADAARTTAQNAQAAFTTANTALDTAGDTLQAANAELTASRLALQVELAAAVQAALQAAGLGAGAQQGQGA